MANILVAEDDHLTRQLLQHSLELGGHQVIAVSDGEEALEVALQEQLDIVLLDLMMPGKSGAQVIQALHDALGTDAVKIIVVTGTMNAKDIPGVSAADRVMSKPISIDELLDVVQELSE